jgi:hypothetical protein
VVRRCSVQTSSRMLCHFIISFPRGDHRVKPADQSDPGFQSRIRNTLKRTLSQSSFL